MALHNVSLLFHPTPHLQFPPMPLWRSTLTHPTLASCPGCKLAIYPMVMVVAVLHP
ncbi:hypothetical protein IQ268_21070 [Oculatella sp. LEGE 06141]|uniref:hypothetical protein n=1 Tax=Oculatella sp. LEGE 06141 TaxID=1828648 RepID=UPI001881556F|nr:hypothetical protein [Oculatella sp. LEGE 06141]MBE9181055.1 hypothetical protein [Oculatella sp. LEGE 06141]